MSRSLRTAFAAAALPLLLLAAACERRGERGATASDGAGDGPVKIGLYADLSGQTAGFGEATLAGARMAVAEINAAGGLLGRPLELVVDDDQGRPEQAATVVTKLIEQDRVVALIGENASSNSLAAAPIAQRAGVPMISPSSTNPKVTAVGDYIFRVCFIDPFQGEVMAHFAGATLGARRAALLVDTNSDYSRGLAQYFEAAFVAAGGEIVERQSYQQSDRDFASQLTTIRAAAPDVLFVPGYYTQAAVIARQAQQLGLAATLLGADGWDAPQLFEIGGDAVDGAFISNHLSVDDPSPRVQKFVADYRQRHGGRTPDSLAVLGYEAVGVLADAARRAGSFAPAKLRDALAETADFPGITGSISIDDDRNAVKPAVVLELRGGKYVYRETVAPGAAGATPAVSNDEPPSAPSPPAPPSAPSASATASEPGAARG